MPFPAPSVATTVTPDDEIAGPDDETLPEDDPPDDTPPEEELPLLLFAELDEFDAGVDGQLFNTTAIPTTNAATAKIVKKSFPLGSTLQTGVMVTHRTKNKNL